MCNNSSGFIHKVFFTSNRAFAEYCASKIRSAHPELPLNIHSAIEPYISGVHRKVSDSDVIRINYYFIDDVVLALPPLDGISNLHVNFLVSEGIDGVAFDLLPCTGSQVPDPRNAVSPCRAVSSEFHEGCRIRRNKGRFRRELISRVQTLNILKSFIPRGHDYFQLGDLLDSCFRKLLGVLHASGGILIIEEKKTGRTVFHRVCGEAFPGRVPAARLRSPAARICASVDSSYAQGYFKIDVEPPVTACGKALVKVFKEQMGLFLDNAIGTREKLERLHSNLPLMEPEAGAPMIADGNGNGRELWMGCGHSGMPVCQDGGCFMDRNGRGYRDLFDNEIRIIGKNGVKRIVKSGRGTDPNAMGRVTCGGAVTGDIAGRLSLENKFGHMEHLAWLGEFASEFAHEIRNPVTGISSSAQFLYETAVIPGEYKAVIEEILLGSRMLEETVKKYLDLAAPPDLRLEECSLNELAEQVCMDMLDKMASQKITVEFELGRGLPKIYVDPGQVRQVYRNLVMNAVEAMPDGGRLVVATFLRTEGADPKNSERARVVSSISDSGTGINPEDTERVFDPFYSTKFSGSGLGLYTAVNILRKHKAAINLFSEAGKGTEVTVSFPLSNGLGQ
ncbi:MAG: hypothetical protein LLG06_03940 [Desulfobacteraceae bacterium]|nr:hypothetical protein [Desulfobacteraceae bacterium]